MIQIPHVLRSFLALLVLALAFSASVDAQSPAERFFTQIFAQQPKSWFPISEENHGNYEESYANGLTTRQSFLLVDPYATGKERYLIRIEEEDLEEFLPEVVFFLGELNCNDEFNDGKLPFIGFSDPNGAGYVLPGLYDVLTSGFLALISRPELKKQGQKEKYAEALTRLLARIRLKQADCNSEILEFSKPKLKWNGTTLNLKTDYDLKCKIGESIEWGPKSFPLEFDFEFREDILAGITVITWP
jgi:hypothetical protein